MANPENLTQYLARNEAENHMIEGRDKQPVTPTRTTKEYGPQRIPQELAAKLKWDSAAEFIGIVDEQAKSGEGIRSINEIREQEPNVKREKARRFAEVLLPIGGTYALNALGTANPIAAALAGAGIGGINAAIEVRGVKRS